VKVSVKMGRLGAGSPVPSEEESHLRLWGEKRRSEVMEKEEEG
jgi:hypothetical protein